MFTSWQQIIKTGLVGSRTIHYFEEVESSNTTALSLARDGAESGSAVIADSQSKGRGRLGKSWQSPPGTGLYFSVVLRPELPASDIPKITLAAGLALCRAVDKVCAVHTMIKWPNDQLINGKKVAGILCESAHDGNDTVVILGIGINVSTTQDCFSKELQETATSLLIATNKFHDKGILLEAVLTEIDSALSQLEAGDFKEILDNWRKRDATIDRWLTWLTPAGDIVKGQSLGPDAEGLLMVRDAGGQIHQVLSGDVSLIKK